MAADQWQASADISGHRGPILGKRALRFLTFRSGVKEISRKKLPARAASDFKLVTRNGKPAVDVGLAGDRRLIVSP